jgi:ADP-heptose:LPS heptosyltransferase
LGDARVADLASWDLNLTSAERDKAAQALRQVWEHESGDRPILAAAIGTKVQAKDWGADNWRALLSQLAAELPEHRLVLVGAAQESADSEAAAVGWRAGTDRALNLCGELTPRETAAVLARAQLFIGLDSGPMHLAAAVGTPVVAIFAARNRPVHWFPVGPQHRILYHRTDCWGCGLETCVEQRKKCLTSITVEEALTAVRRSLATIGDPLAARV